MASQYPRQHTAIDVGAAEHDGNAFPRVKRAFLNGGSQCGSAGALRGVVGVFVELDAGRFAPGMPLRCFIPRARVGRDAPPDRQQQSHKVSIHAPAWGATVSQRPYRRVDPVSIHAPAWGATHIGGATVPTLEVSIHAPAWGATCAPPWKRARCGVSIHAPAWGATSASARFNPWAVSFNPRARVGRDHHGDAWRDEQIVSIHAPAWGATWLRGQCRSARNVSIHAPAWGATQWGAFLINRKRFQSTRPRGARRRPCEPWRIRSCFNPRARVGRDLEASPMRVRLSLFQSTRPRGARPE